MLLLPDLPRLEEEALFPVADPWVMPPDTPVDFPPVELLTLLD
jgi:hypothetical protein